MRTRLASFLAASFLSLSAVAAHAQAPGAAVMASEPDDAGPQTSITVNPVEALLGIPNLAIEHAMGRRWSIQVEGLYLAGAASSNGVSSSASIASLTVQPHFYFGRRALEGFYVAPFVQVVDITAQDSQGGSASAAGAAIGSTIGYAWLLGPVDLELGGGLELMSASAHAVNDDGSTAVASASGAGVTMDLSAGFAF